MNKNEMYAIKIGEKKVAYRMTINGNDYVGYIKNNRIEEIKTQEEFIDGILSGPRKVIDSVGLDSQ